MYIEFEAKFQNVPISLAYMGRLLKTIDMHFGCIKNKILGFEIRN